MKIKMFLIQGRHQRPRINTEDDWPQYKKDQFEEMNKANRGVYDTVYAIMSITVQSPRFRRIEEGAAGLITSDEYRAKRILSKIVNGTSNIRDVRLIETHVVVPDWYPQTEEAHENETAANQV